LPTRPGGLKLDRMNDRDSSMGGIVNDGIARGVAILGLIGIALIHVLEAPEAFEETLYLGLLFVGAVVASLLLAVALTRDSDARVWRVVGGLPALILLCYVISRAIGLPGFTTDVGEWTEPLGLASMVAEGLVVFLTVAVLGEPMARAASAPRGRQAPGAQPGTAAGLG
jgi:hypothetical protein